MNDDLHPDPTDTELLASALVDGTATADEAGAIESSPGTATLADEFRTVRALLADTPPARAEAREQALAAALAVFDELSADAPLIAAAQAGAAPVIHLADRRRWPSRVLAAAAAVVVVGVVGVAVFQSPSEDGSSANEGTAMARVEAASDEYAEAKMAPTVADGNPATTVAGEATAGMAGAGSPARECLEGDQVFVADILYNGRAAIAARDTVTGVTQAIDEQCNVLAEATP
jgi:negative regulator of sigma E activity